MQKVDVGKLIKKESHRWYGENGTNNGHNSEQNAYIWWYYIDGKDSWYIWGGAFSI